MSFNNIGFYRKKKGLTLAQLSKKSNISPGYLCHLENGSRKNPSYKVMRDISNVLEKSITDVFNT